MVEKAFGHSKMAKHSALTIEDEVFTWKRNQDSIAKEAELDGFYVIRTSVALQQLSATDAVAAYKDLATFERAFRTMKDMELTIRPIHHVREDRVRAHVFPCMLAYYVEFHMRTWLAPILFHDDDRESATADRIDIVSSRRCGQRRHIRKMPPSAQRKATRSIASIRSSRISQPSLNHLSTISQPSLNHLSTISQPSR